MEKKSTKISSKAVRESLIERGKKFIFNEQYSEWAIYVRKNTHNLLMIETAVMIMEKLNNNLDLEGANEILKSRNTVVFPSLVVKTVFKFSPYGAHFYQDYNCIISPEKSPNEWKIIELTNYRNILIGKKHGKEIPKLMKGFSATEEQSLDDVLDVLFAAQDWNMDMFAIFKGTKLYSRTVTTNDAYMKIYNMNKIQYKDKMKEKQKELSIKRD